MPWYGAVVWTRAENGQRIYCCQWDEERGGLELPKGGEKPIDSSSFATARRALWKEAGIGLSWRERGDFHWVHQPGQISGFFVTMLTKTDDEVIPYPRREWLTLEGCAEGGLV